MSPWDRTLSRWVEAKLLQGKGWAQSWREKERDKLLVKQKKWFWLKTLTSTLPWWVAGLRACPHFTSASPHYCLSRFLKINQVDLLYYLKDAYRCYYIAYNYELLYKYIAIVIEESLLEDKRPKKLPEIRKLCGPQIQSINWVLSGMTKSQSTANTSKWYCKHEEKNSEQPGKTSNLQIIPDRNYRLPANGDRLTAVFSTVKVDNKI